MKNKNKKPAVSAENGFKLATVKVMLFGVEFQRRVDPSEAEVFNQHVLTKAGKALGMKVEYDLFD